MHRKEWEERKREDKKMEICLRQLLKICNYIYIKLYIYEHINFIYIYIYKTKDYCQATLLYYWNKAVQSWVSWITLFLSHLKVTPFGSFSLSSFCEHSLPWITPRKACYPDRETSPPNLRKSRPLHSLKKHPRGSNSPPYSNRPSSEVTWSSNAVRMEGSYFLIHMEKKKRVSPF